MKVAYIRVSTQEQNIDRQLEALKGYEIEKYFIEKRSAKDTNRPELLKMLDFIREGDEVYIIDYSRLARNTKDLLDIVDKINSKSVKLISLKEKLDSSTPTGKLMLATIGAVNEFLRNINLENQREGIAIAKAKGKYKGRQPVEIDEDKFYTYLEMYNARKINKVKFAKLMDISRPTLDKLLKREIHDS